MRGIAVPHEGVSMIHQTKERKAEQGANRAHVGKEEGKRAQGCPEPRLWGMKQDKDDGK